MVRVRDLAIIGGGTAGLAAGLYAARNRIDSVLFERSGLGGQLINIDRVENFIGFPEPISGNELGPRMANHAMSSGLEVEFREVVRLQPDGEVWRLYTGEDDSTLSARAVIVATGSSLARLNVPGEVEFAGTGVSYCASCDGELFRGMNVAVVGGGDSALDEVIHLAARVQNIALVHRGDSLRATVSLQERVERLENVRIFPNRIVSEIVGDSVVNAIRITNQTKSEHEQLPVRGVFIYVGLKPETTMLSDICDLDSMGHVVVDQGMATSAAGLFAAGDIRRHSARQLASVAGDGVMAALSALKYLRPFA